MVPLSSLLSILEKDDDLSSLLPAAAPSVADLPPLWEAPVDDVSSFICEALNRSSLKEYLRPMIAHERFAVLVLSLTVTLGIHFA